MYLLLIIIILSSLSLDSPPLCCSSSIFSSKLLLDPCKRFCIFYRLTLGRFLLLSLGYYLRDNLQSQRLSWSNFANYLIVFELTSLYYWTSYIAFCQQETPLVLVSTPSWCCSASSAVPSLPVYSFGKTCTWSSYLKLSTTSITHLRFIHH